MDNSAFWMKWHQIIIKTVLQPTVFSERSDSALYVPLQLIGAVVAYQICIRASLISSLPMQCKQWIRDATD